MPKLRGEPLRRTRNDLSRRTFDHPLVKVVLGFVTSRKDFGNRTRLTKPFPNFVRMNANRIVRTIVTVVFRVRIPIDDDEHKGS